MRVWRLDGSGQRSIQVDRWGAKFERQDNGILATQVREDGPLYLRGMRQGDVITRLRLPKRVNDDVTVESVVDPDKMLSALVTHSSDAMIAFRLSPRDG